MKTLMQIFIFGLIVGDVLLLPILLAWLWSYNQKVN